MSNQTSLPITIDDADNLSGLTAEKAACLALLEAHKDTLTGPSDKPRENATHMYTLRGVITSPDIVYVCRRAEPDLIEIDGEPQSADQWWRLAYIADDADPIKAEVSLDSLPLLVDKLAHSTVGCSAQPLRRCWKQPLRRRTRHLTSYMPQTQRWRQSPYPYQVLFR